MSGDINGQAAAWMAVVAKLRERNPHYSSRSKGSALDSALAELDRLYDIEREHAIVRLREGGTGT